MASYLRSQLAQLPSIDVELQNLTTRIDPDRYNGALLAGLNGIVVKSHGSASERGFLHALLQGRDYVAWDIQRCAKNRWSAKESRRTNASSGLVETLIETPDGQTQ